MEIKINDTLERAGWFMEYNQYKLEYDLHEISITEGELCGPYNYDFASSVAFDDRTSFVQFSKEFEVVSGAWYGPHGRWRAKKRKTGRISFQDIRQLQEVKPFKEPSVVIDKPMFRTSATVTISTGNGKGYKFKCRRITIEFDGKVRIFNRRLNQYQEAGSLLSPDGTTFISLPKKFG